VDNALGFYGNTVQEAGFYTRQTTGHIWQPSCPTERGEWHTL